MPEATIVRQQLSAQVLEFEGWVRGELRYNPADPYAVKLVLRQPAGRAVWVFARDLLLDGLDATVEHPVGEYKVQVWRQWVDGRLLVVLRLRQSGVRCELALSHHLVVRFTDQAQELVPRGEEEAFLDLDATVERLLAGEDR